MQPDVRSLRPGLAANLRYDLPAGLVVFLVAVPLCLGIALASGAPLFAGIIAGIVGGLVTGLLSRSAVGVSGPAAGLTVIVLSALATLGRFEVFLLAVVLAGFFQIGFGLLRAGILGLYVPAAVIKGMLAGIGVLIVIKQLPVAAGYVHGNAEAGLLDALTPGALLVTATAVVLMVLWERPAVQRHPGLKLVPGPLLAVVVGTLLAAGLGAFGHAGGPLVALPVADSPAAFLRLFTFPDLSAIGDPAVWTVALTIAAVASLESLLSLEAADELDPFKRVTPPNRELVAQGVGNVVSGLIGGLPITQVVVRTTANVQAGARTHFAAVFHGVLMLLAVVAIPRVLNLIPLAALAGVLILVGYKLAKPALFGKMWTLGPQQFFPFVATLLGVVFLDLLLGIALGLAVAVAFLVYHNYRTAYFLDTANAGPEAPLRLELSEHMTFMNKASLTRTLEHVPGGRHVVIDCTRTVEMDYDVHEALSRFRLNAPTRGVTVDVVGEPGLRQPSVEAHLRDALHLHPHAGRPAEPLPTA